jgi:hypothetical protein
MNVSRGAYNILFFCVCTVMATEFRQSVIQLTLPLKQVLYISNPTLEFLTWMSCGILIFIVLDRTSLTEILNVSHNDNKA